MPSANNKTKMTGDTHLPDTESEFDTQEARESAYDKGQASEKSGSSKDSNDVPGLKDREAKTSNSYGHTRKG